jgi:hypothetical protein
MNGTIARYLLPFGQLASVRRAVGAENSGHQAGILAVNTHTQT